MIKLFALDVDGTLTDGGVYMDGNGNEFKRFDIQDGYGLVMLQRLGIKVAFISGRFSKATQQRADDLKIAVCINGTSDKLKDLQALSNELCITAEEIAYAGDDIPDIECMKWAGFGMAVANARDEVKAAACFVSVSRGGHGAVRELAEHIIMLNERFEK